MNFVGQQIIELTAVIGVGMLCAAIYSVYAFLHRWLKPRLWLSNICDFLFWLCLTVLVFGLLLLINYGDVRFYVFAGLIIGAIVYFNGAKKLFRNSVVSRSNTAKYLSGRGQTGKNVK